MFQMSVIDDDTIKLVGRFDSPEQAEAEQFFAQVARPRCIDMSELSFISSSGLRVLIATQKRVAAEGGAKLQLRGLSKHIAEIFRITRLDTVFDIV
jgi:anti-sigma B factor antagonist